MSSPPVESLIARLPGGKWNGKNYTALCPAHDDHKPSLSISEGEDGRALLKCQAGCETKAILEAIGLQESDLFPDTPKASAEIVATYDYTDETGNLLFQVVRFNPKDFRQRRRDSNGEWMWRLETTRRVPYRLPRVIEEAAHGGVVHVVEGEKDVKALEAVGSVATCNPGGAGKWKPEYADYLRGAHVIVVQDKDQPGREHAATVAATLKGKAASVVIVEAKEGKDAADHLAAGYGLEDFVLAGAAETAPNHRLQILTAAELLTMTPDRPEWIAEPLVARGCITDLVAGPKVGKSTLALALAAAVCEGRPFLGKPTTQTRVLYLTEEGSSTFRASLERVGLTGDALKIVLRHAGTGKKWAEVMEAATAEALEAEAGLLIIDTLAHWAALKGDEENSSGAVLEALRPVQAAAETGLAVLLGRHDRKGPAAELGEAGRGSNATAGACDILMGLRKLLGQGHENRRRLDYLSRFDGLPPSQIVEWRAQERTYALLGTEADIQFRACREALLSLLPDDEPATEKEILESFSDEQKPPRSTLQRVLGDLLEHGQAERTGEGKKGSPYRYARRVGEYVPA